MSAQKEARILVALCALLLCLPRVVVGEATTSDASARSQTPDAGAESLPASIGPVTPATLPPAPNMLGDPAPVGSSPFRSSARSLSPRETDQGAGNASGDEPLWVLPAHLIAPSAESPRGVVPGARMTRDRGYLDTPETIAGITREPLLRDSGRLERGLSWDYCGPRTPGARFGAAVGTPMTSDADNREVLLDAGGVSYERETEIVRAQGGVTLERGSERVEAPRIDYDRGNNEVQTYGSTYLQRDGLRVLGRDARYSLDDQSGRVDDAYYRLAGPINLRGRTDTLYLDDPEVTRYENLTYTTCPPGSNAWALRAGKLRLDQGSGVGVARDARLKIGGVPVMYTPYLQFPIDDRRKSGFLIPSIGSSDQNGFELLTPYYWNIAPNYDATFYPRWMSDRGLMLGGEFRYLTGRDEGTLFAEVLPNDSGDEENRTRGALRIEEEGRFFQRWRTLVDYQWVSDEDYLNDFGTTLDVTSSRYLESQGQLTYGGKGWSLLTRVQAFQNLDPDLAPSSRPYGRVPQMLLRTRPMELGWGSVASLEAEYDYFDHSHRVHGHRLSVLPTLSWPLRRSYGHLIPSVRAYLSGYNLVGQEPDAPTDPGHTIPSVDLDGKLVFERELSLFGNSAVQTLEPRVYYLYTPYQDQDDTPVFDSAELSFSFSNLFRPNRFTGRDRIGDANQVTTALTSRTLDAATGVELFRLSLGQIQYFEDRRVQISGDEVAARSSPYAGELSANLFDRWYGRASFEWDPDLAQDQWQRRTLQLEYRGEEDRLLNLAYRADDSVIDANRYEDTDLSFRLPVGQRVEVVGRWLYSLRNEQTMDAFAGIELGDCCWRLRVLGRHFKRRPDEVASTSIMLQVELAGLGAIGNPIGEFLETEINDYRVD